ncbi:MAG TPA: GNAT family N-acetyltransferase [Pyrinomonadaceae bacterium]|nr:GNAT family N-acetyltransferase [Pyrinomonadaceae bacterium]
MAFDKKTISFDLRPVTAADDEFLLKLYGTTREDEMNAAGFSPEQREQFVKMQFTAQKNHYENFFPNSIHRIITTDGKPIGREYVFRSEIEILVLDLLLLPEFCGFGIGTTLLEKFFDESRRTKIPVRLHADKGNERALNLYLRLGFYQIEELDFYYFLEWSEEKSEKVEK